MSPIMSKPSTSTVSPSPSRRKINLKIPNFKPVPKSRQMLQEVQQQGQDQNVKNSPLPKKMKYEDDPDYGSSVRRSLRSRSSGENDERPSPACNGTTKRFLETPSYADEIERWKKEEDDESVLIISKAKPGPKSKKKHLTTRKVTREQHQSEPGVGTPGNMQDVPLKSENPEPKRKKKCSETLQSDQSGSELEPERRRSNRLFVSKPGPKSKKKFLEVSLSESNKVSAVTSEGELQNNNDALDNTTKSKIKQAKGDNETSFYDADTESAIGNSSSREVGAYNETGRCSDSGCIMVSDNDHDYGDDLDDLFIAVTKPKKSSSQSHGSESPIVPQGHYEIEDVLDYVNESQGVGEMYLIKWKNWESDFNTWEPPQNLIDCEDVLLKFYYKRKAEVEEQIAAQVYVEFPSGRRKRKGPDIWKIPPDPRPLDVQLNEFYAATKPLCENKLKDKYLSWNRARNANKGRDTRMKWSESKLNKYLTDGTAGKLSEEQVKDLRRELYYVEVERKKSVLDGHLKGWEASINIVTQFKPVITVENNVDLEGPPEDFKFVSSYIPAAGITIPSDPPVGCSCEESCYDNRKNCCGHLSGGQFAYSRFRKVAVPLGTPIWECNKMCSCGPDCVNRVVQDGSNSEVKLCIFRTFNGCGWGVKALKSIKRGCFVCLYVGEVIYAEEAERRSREEKGIQPYLFDLDFNDHANPVYTVDASRFGNVSHFFNHSCDPNLGVYAVWVDCLDPNLPKLAMFAVRDIAKGEELSFDYLNRVSSESSTDEEDDVDSGSPGSPSKAHRNASQKKQKCLCGADNCRQFLYV